MQAPGKFDAGARLPELRQDLTLIRPDRADNSAPHWLIYDPVRHRYAEVDGTTFEVLSTWRSGMTAAALIKATFDQTGKRISLDDVAELIRFVEQEHLVADPKNGDWRQMADASKRMRRGAGSWLVHNYIFFKVPLVRPQAFLQRTLWVARLLVSRWALRLVGLLGMIGIYLVSRQWDEFLATFADFLSVEGIAAFGLAVIFVKVLHELGHAYTAVHHGCRVPAMGLAFMLMTPMLYTDVTDAWRLGSRRKRLAIDAAGVSVELIVAAIATFMWPFLPSGLLKGVVFAIATTSWLMSLFVNLNPFMRFDGYYLLSDYLGVQNLQPRAFALSRWWLREFLFGLRESPPELFSQRRQRLLVAYGFGTWIYRLLLFVGIALVVYHFFFKALGIILFLIEIAIFVARPIWHELMEWRKRMPAIRKTRRSYLTFATLAALLLLAVVPWSGRVSVPVVVEPAAMVRVYPPQPADVVSIDVAHGQRVEQGQVLGTLRSEMLESERSLVETKMRSAEARLARVAADSGDREQVAVLRRELHSLTTRRDGLSRLADALTLRAPVAGRVVELSRAMHPGRSISRKDLVMVIANDDAMQARGYVAEKDAARLDAGAPARLFFDDGRVSTLDMRVADIGESGVAGMEIDDLASVHGGPIDASLNADGRIIPVAAQYPIRFAISKSGELPDRRIRGVAIVEGQRESFAHSLWRQVVRIAVREGGI